MLGYIVTIFLSAFLLFQVQPLIGKFILPWFGGGPAVWMACMLFFQALLLFGYAYAHLTTWWDRHSCLSLRSLTGRNACPPSAGVHLAVLALSLAALPIIPSAERWKPSTWDHPVANILLLLFATVGAPYLVLSTTGPLLQDWFARTHPGRSPYRLYALSNLGSFLALLSYPFLFEPMLPLRSQALAWSAAYVAFVALCGWRAFQFARSRGTSENDVTVSPKEDTQDCVSPKPTGGVLALWLLLPFAGSVALLATTNQLCQEVAVVPFLWVMPLAIYLLTFVICFEYPRLYLRNLPGLALLFAAAGLAAWVLSRTTPPHLPFQILIYGVVLYFLCMSCHGEMARLKPATRHLTLYYLMIAAGGALGGAFVVLVAPAAFSGYWELHIAILLACVLVLAAHFRDPASYVYLGRPVWVWGILVVATVALGHYLNKDVQEARGDALARSRNFYGVLKVRQEWESPAGDAISLTHGSTSHGFQFKDAAWKREPTTYYYHGSGIGVAIDSHPRRWNESPDNTLRIGVVGLGTGTIAALGRDGDVVRFYEINPAVVRLCDQYFTYLQDTPAETEVVLGDARVSMERELKAGGPQNYDVIAVDAFTSDAIPMHLLTRECAEVYLAHLKPDGILAIHISNRYLDLAPVVRALAAAFGREAVLVDASGDSEAGGSRCDWVLVTSNRAFLDGDALKDFSSAWPSDSRPPILWTDNYGSLFQILD